MSDDYKRQVDFWIKISLVATPLLTTGINWGVIRTTVSNIEKRVGVLEDFAKAEIGFKLDQVKMDGEVTEQAKEMNRRLERIEVILDSRLRK